MIDNLASMSVVQVVTAIVTTVTETNSKVNNTSCYIQNILHGIPTYIHILHGVSMVF